MKKPGTVIPSVDKVRNVELPPHKRWTFTYVKLVMRSSEITFNAQVEHGPTFTYDTAHAAKAAMRKFCEV